MKLAEITLKEETLQQAIKRLLRPAGSLSSVMGPDAALAAKLLAGKTTDSVFVLRGDNPQAEKMLKSVVLSRPFETADSEDHGQLRVIRLPGGARLLVIGDGPDAFVVATDYQMGRLVEDSNG